MIESSKPRYLSIDTDRIVFDEQTNMVRGISLQKTFNEMMNELNQRR
jgi:hypothetical protein